MAGKWIAATVSTMAALVSILSVARTYGMVGEAGPSTLAIGPLAAAWVGLSPANVTATSIGDTVHLAATVTNKSGSVLVGSWLQWSSDDTTIATVNEDGTVIARAPGTTTIVLIVGSHIARSRVTVKPQPYAVQFIPDTGIVVPEGGHARVRPHIVDAHGYVIQSATPTMRIADTTIAIADTSGLIIAGTPGRTTLEATAAGITARTDIRVVAVPGALSAVSGSEQHASAGRALPAPVVVRVLSLRGRSIAGVPVHFTTGEGQGLADPATVITDSAGRARTTWTLGEMPGRHRLFARTESLDTALTVLAEADPVAANLRHSILDDAQVAVVGDTLPARVGVRVTDSTGRALADIPVSWSAGDRDSIVAIADRTDSLGEARARWLLGPRAGEHRARVQIGGTRAIPAYPLTAIARPAAPKGVVVRSGEAQRAVVGATLKPIVMKVVDRFDNPVPGATVTISPAHGSVADSVLATDSAGTVSIRWTLGGAVGTQKLAARVSGIAKPVDVIATASIGRAAKASFSAPTATGVAGKPLASPTTVTITDAFGNPIVGATVAFTTAGGSVSQAKATTDARGRATTKWTFGSKVGTQTLTASVSGTPARATLEAEVAKGATASAKAPAKAPAAKPALTKPAAKAPAKKSGVR
jgi:adhesin/invasin